MSPEETSDTGLTARKASLLRRWLRILSVIIIAGGLLSIFVGLGKRLIQPPLTWNDIHGPPPSYFVDKSKPLREQTVTVELGKRVFEIPLMYIDNGQPDELGVYKDSIRLEVIWPEMTTIYQMTDRAEYDRVTKDERRRGWILLERADSRPSIDVQVGNMQASMTRWEHVGIQNGLEKVLWYRGPSDSPELRHEVYLAKNAAGQITTYIDCRRGPTVRFPGCSHKFTNDGIIYKISYNEGRFLSEWRQQERRAIDLLNAIERLPDNIATHGG